MSNTIKICLIVAAVLVVFGLLLFVVVMIENGWDLSKNSTVNETNEYEITESFADLSINTDTADIVFLSSDDDKCRVVCFERQKTKHSVSVVDGVLTIKVNDEQKWYDHIFSVSFKSQKITVYLPLSEYGSLVINESTGKINIPSGFTFDDIVVSSSTGDVECCASAVDEIKITLSTGDVLLKNLSAKNIFLSATTGKATVSSVNCDGDIKVEIKTGKSELTDVECKNFTSDGSTGSLSLQNVLATEKFVIERSTGDITFKNCDAAEISVKTDTGDVTGSLLSSKVFIVTSDTGKIDVPKTTIGGVCEITTSTGNIKINVLSE